MDKINELTKQQKEDDKLLVSKVLDKIKFVEARNRFENTDFLDLAQKQLISEMLQKRNQIEYEFFGGFEEAERTMLILMPEDYLKLENINGISNEYNKLENSNNFFDKTDKLNYENDEIQYSNDVKYNHDAVNNKMITNIYNQIMSIIRITLPKELWGTFEHRTYLGALMKIGLKREKIGDILVRHDGADIVISNDIKNFMINNINQLTRFQKAKIESLKIDQIKYTPAKNEIIKINVPSMRLDAIIGELAKCSRSDSSELLEQERVMVNFKEEIRGTRIIEDNTMITIRGKGRFKINKILGNTKSGRINVEVTKW